jgi:hypothetical protein
MRNFIPLVLASAACLGMHAAPISPEAAGQPMQMLLNEDDQVVLHDDYFEMPRGSILEVGAPGVLANDQLHDPADAQAVLLEEPSSGVVELNLDGSFTYLPDDGFVGTAVFSYTLANGDGQASVYIQVHGGPSAPITTEVVIEMMEGEIWDDPFTLHDLVHSPDGLDIELMLYDLPRQGVLELRADGSFKYIPDDDFNGKDRFSYLAVDSFGETATGLVTIIVHAVNDAPSFQAGGDVILPAGTQDVTIAEWATNISAGPDNESHQDLWFVISILQDDNGMLDMLPELDLSGNLTIALNAGVSGEALLQVVLFDYDPYTDETGKSEPQLLRIVVESSYQAPSFLGTDVVEVIAIAGEEYNLDWASAISGGSDVALDELEFAIVDISNPDMFDAGPSIDVASGMLYFVLAHDDYAECSVTVVLQSVDGTHLSDFVTFNILAHPIPENGILSVKAFEGSEAPRGAQQEAGCASNAGGKSWLLVLSILVILSVVCVHRRSAA